MAVPDGGAVAGRAGAVRELEHDLQELQSMVRAGRVGAGAGEGAVACAAVRRPGLGRVDRLHDRARAPAWRDTSSHHGALSNYKKFGEEPPDHAIGRSRGGLTTKNHLVCDGKGRALAFIITPGQAADTSMLAATLSGSASRFFDIARVHEERRAELSKQIVVISYSDTDERVWLSTARS